MGVWRPSTGQFFLDWDNNGLWNSPPDKSFVMGIAGDRPLVGDWNGDGIDQMGLYRDSTGWFFLENQTLVWNGCGGGETCFATPGLPGDLPAAGNWPGSVQNGRDKVGLYRRSTGLWFLEAHANNAWNGCAAGELCRGPFGLTTDWPLAGNWTGVGTLDKIGVFRPSTRLFYLDNRDYTPNAQRDQYLGPFGLANDVAAVYPQGQLIPD